MIIIGDWEQQPDGSKTCIEYGIKYPNRNVRWVSPDDHSPTDVATEQGRGKAQDDYADMLRMNGIEPDESTRLTFVERTARITYSTITEVK